MCHFLYGCLMPQALYGRSNCPNFVETLQLPIVFDNKRPSFHEEIKVKLPFALEESHHLLFSFFSCNLQAMKKDSQYERLLGYAVLPVFPNGRLVTALLSATNV